MIQQWLLVLILFDGRVADHHARLHESQEACRAKAVAAVREKQVVGAVCVAKDGSASFHILKHARFTR